ncbi:hypothetical protein SAMN05421820_101471 [Pedobacter steynii]|uniref:TerB family tellurite resistance protein n=1 Tax=Pedobacter steynii TaxID=430522 RepID=A0A1G9K625_9SPHI|nr:hypothetical protein [Pedobacter steynii]NQX38450.1 hypothetical protein [Pedobacter steynii]SDL44815.1 hypothetical protein SAMN05421820_101471 [Pedobacter steynii]
MEYRSSKCFTFLYLVLLGFCPLLSSAQTFAEFFKQKKTQKKYLVQQIAALQVYLGYAKKGYDIAGSGLNTIKKLTTGEFTLHSAFIASLSSVSPYIRSHFKLAEIVLFQKEIVKGFSGMTLGRSSGLLSDANRVYIQSVKAKVLMDCAMDLEMLLLIISPGLLEMDDKARLDKLDELYKSMQNKAAFTRAFAADVQGLVGSKEMDLRSVHFLNKAYGNVE